MSPMMLDFLARMLALSHVKKTPQFEGASEQIQYTEANRLADLMLQFASIASEK